MNLQLAPIRGFRAIAQRQAEQRNTQVKVLIRRLDAVAVEAEKFAREAADLPLELRLAACRAIDPGDDFPFLRRKGCEEGLVQLDERGPHVAFAFECGFCKCEPTELIERRRAEIAFPTGGEFADGGPVEPFPHQSRCRVAVQPRRAVALCARPRGHVGCVHDFKWNAPWPARIARAENLPIRRLDVVGARGIPQRIQRGPLLDVLVGNAVERSRGMRPRGEDALRVRHGGRRTAVPGAVRGEGALR